MISKFFSLQPNILPLLMVVMASGLVGCAGRLRAPEQPPQLSIPPDDRPAPVETPTVTPSPVPTTTVAPAPTSTEPSVSPQSTPKNTPPVEKKSEAASPSPAISAQGKKLISKIQKDIESKVTLAKQDTGRTYLSTLLIAQQAEKLVKGSFSTNFKQLAPELEQENEDYRILIQKADENEAIMQAIAKKPGYVSYTGVAYAMESSIPLTGICKTNEPSQDPPSPPAIKDAGLICPPGSSAVQ